MTATLRVVMPEHASPSHAVRTLAQGGAMLALAPRAVAALTAELGNVECVTRFLANVATEAGRPIAVNVPTSWRDPAGPSTTLVLGPGGWSQARLAGWVAVHHEALAAEFGGIAKVERMWPQADRTFKLSFLADNDATVLATDSVMVNIQYK